jgi:hypothetical protein
MVNDVSAKKTDALRNQNIAIDSTHIDSRAYDSMIMATTFMYPVDPWAFPVNL